MKAVASPSLMLPQMTVHKHNNNNNSSTKNSAENQTKMMSLGGIEILIDTVNVHFTNPYVCGNILKTLGNLVIGISKTIIHFFLPFRHNHEKMNR